VKIKWSWIVLALVLVAIVVMVLPKLRSAAPALEGPSALDSPRSYQATPDAVVHTFFEMYRGSYAKDPITDALMNGKYADPDQQKFAQLFWDHDRAWMIYKALYDRDAELISLGTATTVDGSVRLPASVRILSVEAEDGQSEPLYNFELRQRGDNWYIYELRGQKSPEGLVAKTQEYLKNAPR
jgi:hypothetical protein